MSAVLHSKIKIFVLKKVSQQIKWPTKNHHEKLRCVTNEGKNWETLGTSFKQESIFREIKIEKKLLPTLLQIFRETKSYK